ncbi:MAG: ABC transporter ATP-binding protein [Thermoanaerobaculia bacterium]|nr:ABC transporter ATP-binding protein [Thermoanaerobaculia bacterium]
MSVALLELDRLSLGFSGPEGRPTEVLREVSFSLGSGEIVGLVGESGSGKSLTALSILGLEPSSARITGGAVRLRGNDLRGRSDREMAKIRGREIGMVFQEARVALNPVLTIGSQITETIRAHDTISRREARRRGTELLDRVGIPDPEERMGSYPHELSGGQCQRVTIAMALAAGPEILLADEPTTGLDVTIQAQILELLRRLRRDLGLSVLLVTHDLGVVAETCDRVVVLYAGEVVEEGSVEAIFEAPAHPYTRALLRAVPRLGDPAPRGEMSAIPGSSPSAEERPAGCPFHPRCPEVMEVCRRRHPGIFSGEGGRPVRCFLYSSEGEASR